MSDNLASIESQHGVRFPEELHVFLKAYQGRGVKEWGRRWHFARPSASGNALTFATPFGEGATPLFSKICRRIAWSPAPVRKTVPFIHVFELLAEEARAKGRTQFGGYLPAFKRDNFDLARVEELVAVARMKDGLMGFEPGSGCFWSLSLLSPEFHHIGSLGAWLREHAEIQRYKMARHRAAEMSVRDSRGKFAPEVEKLEKAIGKLLPVAYREFLASHDGTIEYEHRNRPWRLATAQAMRQEDPYAFFYELTGLRTQYVCVGEENGDYLFFDLQEGTTVFAWYHDGGYAVKLAPDFAAWLRKAKAM